MPHSIFLTSTHQTSSDVLDGLLDVHAWPVIQHVTDAGCTVDKPDIIFTSFWHCVETGSKKTHRQRKPQTRDSYTNSWVSIITVWELMSDHIKTASVHMASGLFESEWKCKFVCLCVCVCVCVCVHWPAVLQLQCSETSQAGLFVNPAQVVSQY